ncbi:MAG: tetratricopeptide repeat protein [Noviherbaspirillum sp.]|nr:tetratricopeptide repeat protein [Noviherbaspirillum sp.]
MQYDTSRTMIIKSRRKFNLSSLSALNRIVALSGALAFSCAVPAYADEAAEVTKLLRSGKHSDALIRADAYLGKNPRDAQMRFLKGVILSEQNKLAEAITIFTRMTEDYPSLPEPYNNLAVLYAGNGQYEKARQALDAAIRTNPSYATAYENLGDVHAKLASQAYDKALQVDSGNASAKSKLTLVRTLQANVSAVSSVTDSKPAVSAPVPPPVPANATAEKTPEPAPKVVAATPAPAPAPAPKVAAATPAPQPAAPASKAPPPAPAQTAKLEPKEAAKPKVEPKPIPARNVERDEIIEVVQDWAKAWSARDVKSYLNFYSNDFETPNGQARNAWEDERRSRIVGKGRIHVKIESPEVSVNGNTATAKFRQVYISDRLTANTRKTLLLVKHAGKWQIKQEQAAK